MSEENGDKDLVYNYQPDIGMDEATLVLIGTKELNKELKKCNASKERIKEIKQRRRTLKNRGYAANCRVKRDSQEQQLEAGIADLKDTKDSLNMTLSLLQQFMLEVQLLPNRPNQ